MSDIIAALAWPVAAVIVALLFRRDLALILRRIRSWKFLGQEIVLGEEEAKELTQDAERRFDELRKQAKWEYDRLVRVYGIREKLEKVLQLNVREVLGDPGAVPQFRCAIHVPDLLFADTLYQIVDYYPRGEGRGRRWSIRFGIIGRVWRLRESEIEGSVPTDARALIRFWGMTQEEVAKAGGGRQSFACVPLSEEQQPPVGLFYMDSTAPNAFGATKAARDRLLQATVAGCAAAGLTRAIAELRKEIAKISPQIRIYD